MSYPATISRLAVHPYAANAAFVAVVALGKFFLNPAVLIPTSVVILLLSGEASTNAQSAPAPQRDA